MPTSEQTKIAERLVEICRRKRLGVNDSDYDFDNSKQQCLDAIVSALQSSTEQGLKTVGALRAWVEAERECRVALARQAGDPKDESLLDACDRASEREQEALEALFEAATQSIPAGGPTAAVLQ